MAVTRKCYVIKCAVVMLHDELHSYIDRNVDRLLAAMAPAERIVSTTSFERDGYKYIYIFTESFGLGPKGTP